MGGIMVRAGHSNDHLIDVLIEENYIKSSKIEKVLRAVDRAEYYLPGSRCSAYNGLAWKCLNIHMSAPCVYSTVLEALCLEPGLSFLNLGSGTGYLSTIIGLILGTNGLNHGIEYYQDVIDYANVKLDEFRKYSGAVDEFDYCEPKFIQGNCLCLNPDYNCQYDRVYCGAGVPEQYESYMKSLLKVGGILVMPFNDNLLQVKRTSDTLWETEPMLPVSFATMIQPKPGQNMVQTFEVEPLSLQALCRTIIRDILRKNIELEHPDVKKQKKAPTSKAVKKKRVLGRLVVPLFESDDSSDEERQRVNREIEERGGLLVIGTVFSGNSNDNSRENIETEPSTSEDNKMETDTTELTEDCCDKQNLKVEKFKTQKVETQAVIEHNPHTSYSNSENWEKLLDEKLDTPQNADPPKVEDDENSLDSLNKIHHVFVNVVNVIKNNETDNITTAANSNESNSQVTNEETPSSSNNRSRENKKREKFDSGLGDEIIENQSDSSDDERDMKLGHFLDAISSSDEDSNKEKRIKRGAKKEKPLHKSLKWRRIESNSNRLTESSSENDNEEAKTDDEMRMYESPYTVHMVKKIQELPLPHILKRYLNYHREF